MDLLIKKIYKKTSNQDCVKTILFVLTHIHSTHKHEFNLRFSLFFVVAKLRATFVFGDENIGQI